MSSVTVKAGSSSIVVDTPVEAMLRAIDEASADLAQLFRTRTEELFRQAYDSWPVKTGRSRSGLRWAAGVRPDGVVYARIWHEAQPGDTYTRFVRFSQVVSHPMQPLKLRKGATRDQRRQAEKRRANKSKLFAVTHLLGNPWRRVVVPELREAVEALVAARLREVTG